MSYFSAISAADRITFEGHEVSKITPIKDRATDTITHYALTVVADDKSAIIRKFTSDEIPYLIESELLQIDRGYYSLARQADRAIHGKDEIFGAKRKQRNRVNLIMFLCNRIAHHHKLGMPLTPEGIQMERSILEREFADHQARITYGTEKANATQHLKPLPANTTLLEYYRRIRKAAENPMVFVPPRVKPVDLDLQAAEDFLFILRVLYGYASSKQPAKSEIATEAVKEVAQENERRRAAGIPHLIPTRSPRTYERWIDWHLDPFTLEVERKGFAAAKAKFGSIECGLRATFPGEKVYFDAWQVHCITLDTTRARYNAMSEEQRSKVKKVRRWVVVAIDVATRAILGFAFCRAPNQEASLSALRMCFADKTSLQEEAGVSKSSWDYRAPIHHISTDNGSEFGKHPFGGAEFGEAVRRLSGSLLATVAGVAELRSQIERIFLTFELKWARHLPGWTAGKIHLRNDRKPSGEACMTDDELERLFVQFIAEYHTTKHRGLEDMTPAGTWQKLSKNPQFDLTCLPGPAALREACGIDETAGISKEGILFKNLVYSNEFIRDQRMTRGSARIARPGEKISIKVDPFNLGAISVVTDDGLVSVPCLDDSMRGKSLGWWKNQQAAVRAEAAKDQAEHAAARKEAQDAWRGEADLIARSSGIDLLGRSLDQIDRLARQLKFGKGANEKPFVGRDEYVDPVFAGFETGTAPVETGREADECDTETQIEDFDVANEEDAITSAETSGDTGQEEGLARFRRNGKARSAKRNPGETH